MLYRWRLCGACAMRVGLAVRPAQARSAELLRYFDTPYISHFELSSSSPLSSPRGEQIDLEQSAQMIPFELGHKMIWRRGVAFPGAATARFLTLPRGSCERPCGQAWTGPRLWEILASLRRRCALASVLSLSLAGLGGGEERCVFGEEGGLLMCSV
jgi:hypothetical protein